MDRIILPTIAAMRDQGRVFKGVLYAGLMVTELSPMLLEYNVRLGDPEAQALIMRLISDPLPALIAAHDGILRQVDLRWHADLALCVVMAARGYPDDPERGSEIRWPRRRRQQPRDQDLPRRHPPRACPGPRVRPRAGPRTGSGRGLAPPCRWRARPRHHRVGQRPHPSPRPRLRRDRPDRLAGRLLPPRHRPPRGFRAQYGSRKSQRETRLSRPGQTARGTLSHDSSGLSVIDASSACSFLQR